MKHIAIILITTVFSSSSCMQLAQLTISKDKHVFLEAFNHKKDLFLVPNHIANMCKTLRDPIVDMSEPETKSFTFTTCQSSTVIEGTLACLEFVNSLNSTHDETRTKEKKIKYFMSNYTRNQKDLISISNLLLYLNPQESYNEDPQPVNKKPLIQKICEEALIQAAIESQSTIPHYFTSLNPDMSPENVPIFIKKTALVARLLSAYFRNTALLPKSTPHPIFKKEIFDIPTVLYCTENYALYITKIPQIEEIFKMAKHIIREQYSKKYKTYLTAAINENKEKSVKYRLKNATNLSCMSTNDAGNICIFKESSLGILFKFTNNTLSPFSGTDFTFCCSNQNIYSINYMGKVCIEIDNVLKQLIILPDASYNVEIASDMYDTLLACRMDNNIYLIDLTKHHYVKAQRISIDKLLGLSTHSFTIEKISLHPNGKWLYLLIRRSNRDRDDYVYHIQKNNLEFLQEVPKNYTVSAIEWSFSFVIRAYADNKSAKPKTFYVISHLNTGNTCLLEVHKPFFCFSRNGTSYIEKNKIDNVTTYTTIPLITETVEKIVHIFNNLSSFNVALLLDKLINHNNAQYKTYDNDEKQINTDHTTLDDYEYELYNKYIPEEIKNIFKVQEKK
jgi:hypothetical protein